MEDFIKRISEISLPSDIIVPSSSGRATELTLANWVVKPGQRIIHSPGLASMGFAIPHAIGASFASGRRVICIEGDGSLQLNVQELEVIRRHNLNIKIFILDNKGYDSIRSTQDRYFGRRAGCDISLPNIKKIAIAYGIHFTKSIEHSLSMKEPTICTILC